MTHESSICAVLDGIRQMLEYTDNSVTRNASEKKINSLLDFISASSDLDLLQV
jgi:COP9 signalosome complex subunit 2